MRGFFSLFVLAVLTALSTWLLWTVQSSLNDDDSQANASPSIYLENFQATRMSKDGFRQYTLDSPYLVQLPGDQGTLVTTPHMVLFHNNGRTQDWVLRAEQAKINVDGSVIVLQQAVNLTRVPTAGNLPLTIDTRDVVVRPGDKRIEGNQAMQLQAPTGLLRGTGFIAYLDSKKLELLADVQGNYKSPFSD